MKVAVKLFSIILAVGILAAFKNPSHDSPTILPIKKDQIVKVSAGYGLRTHPVNHTKKLHTGIDYIAPIGTNVLATADGKVTKISHDHDQYGTQVTLTHTNGVKTIYSHLSEIVVELGEMVTQQQVIAKVGNTGASTGPHLHYEIEVNNEKIDPATYINN